MRFPLVVLVAALTAAGCGRSVTVVRPLEEVKTDLDGGFHGGLVLTDGDRIALGEMRLVGGWVCGSTGPISGDFCVAEGRIRSVEKTEHRPGLELVALIPMAIPAAIWVGSEEADKHERRRQDAEAVEEHRILTEQAIASGRPPPAPLPTRESRRRDASTMALAVCLDADRTRGVPDPAALADRVWRQRDGCLVEASEWFIAHGEFEKGRGLTFVAEARKRYVEVACGRHDPGLRAPVSEQIGTAGARWMGEYRAVVADSGTYANVTPECGAKAPTRAALDSVRSSFPLTEFGPVPLPAR